MPASATRVATRYMRALRASEEDLAGLLARYRGELARYAAHEKTATEWLRAHGEIERLGTDPASETERTRLRETHLMEDVRRDARGNIVSYKLRSSGPAGAVGYNGRSGEVGRAADRLGLAILQQLKLPPNLRKAVEVSVRWWGKKVTLPKGDAPRVEMYLEHLEVFRKYERLYEDALRLGAPHSEEGEGATRTPVGPFTVVNGGGFGDDVMAQCAEVVAEVARRMTTIGLGKVCYGDLLITGKLMNKKNVMAFYSPASDEMFIRPVQATDDAVRFICHEITHRLVSKMLHGRRPEIEALYETVQASGRFVTPYARTGGPEENFCEMVSFWAMGRLPQDQIALLERVIG